MNSVIKRLGCMKQKLSISTFAIIHIWKLDEDNVVSIASL